MNKKQKRNRQKRRREARAHLLSIAKRTGPSAWGDIQPFQYSDGVMVHCVVKDKRSFNRNADFPTAQSDYITCVVWATRCNIVICVNDRSFSSTAKPPTCLACVAPPAPRFDYWDEWR